MADLDKSIQKSREWLKDAQEYLGWDDHQTYVGVRSVLHTLRDRLTPEQSAHLASQMPILLAGTFYENYSPKKQPQKLDRDGFYNQIIERVGQPSDREKSQKAAMAVMSMLYKRISEGEFNDILAELPKDLQEDFKRVRSH